MKTKAKYRFIEFVRPDGWWPQPYTLEQAFGVFAWILKTGSKIYDQSGWGRRDIRSLLSCKPTCVNFSEVEPVVSVQDLERRFHHAILSGFVGPNIRAWREKLGITPDGEAIISFPHHGWKGGPFSEHDARCGIDALLGAEGRLGVQLNECHSRAREIYGVRLHWRGSYRFVLRYGYDGSEWDWLLARQLPGEAFYTTFQRAQRRLADLVDGKQPAREDAA